MQRIRMSDQFTHLVLSGGGLCGVAYLGMLRFLQVEGFDKNIHHVAGSSIGALFATIYALRISLTNIEKHITQMLTEGDGLTFPYPDMLSVITNYGFDDGHKFLSFLRAELKNITFMDLSKKTGVHLVICATHVQTMTPTYFSVDTTPNVLVYDALRASMSVPWIMKPVTIGEDQYIDGGISDNLPYRVFDGVPPGSVLMGNIFAFSSIENPMSSPLAYTYAIMQSFTSPVHMLSIMSKVYPHIITFDKCPMPFIPLRFQENIIQVKSSQKEIEDTIVYGYEVTYEHLKSKLTLQT